MERSAMRDYLRTRREPGFRFAPSGLRAAPRASQEDLDRLFLGVAQELRQAALLADAGILEAAVGRALEVIADAVDPDHAGLHAARGLERPLDVVGPHRRRQSVLDRVGELDGGFLVA